MPKTSTSAVTEKCQKLARPRSRKYAKNLPGSQSQKDEKNAKVSIYTKMPKARRYAVKENAKKLAGARLWKNAKNSQVRGEGKFQKLVGPRSQKNAKNSQVHGHEIMPNNFQVRGYNKWKKNA